MMLATFARGDLSDENRLPLPGSAAAWWDYLAVALKDWEQAVGRLPDAITHLLIPLVCDAAVRFRDADFASTAAGRAVRKRMTGGSIPRPARGVTDQTVLTVIRTWAGGTPLKLVPNPTEEYVPIADFVAAALHEGRPVTLLSTPTHRFGWLDPVVFVERVLGCRDIRAEVCDADWAIALLRLSFHRRDEALAVWKSAARADAAIDSLIQVALDPDFNPVRAIGDPRLLVAAMRARSPHEVISKDWEWTHGLVGHGTHDPVDFAWTFPPQLNRSFPDVRLTIVDHARQPGTIAPEALPPVSLYRGLAPHGRLCRDSSGIPPQSGSALAVWPACPDIFWTRWAMEAVERDINRFGNMNLPHYCLGPLDQLDQPVTRTAIRWLWIGWNNGEARLRSAVLRRTVDLLRQSRLDGDAVVDVFDSMNPCDWWSPRRLREAFTSMVEDAPETAAFFGDVVGRCVAIFSPAARGLKQFAQLAREWRR
jgi:hypothetical protein